MDDFGTGHSALAYLRQFPLDSLKVDRSFVRGIETNQDMASILRAVTTLTRQLGLQMVAEGIEKEEQLELIRSLDCEFGQGFLFSKPVDRDRATELLRSGLPDWPAEAEAHRSAPSTDGRYLWTMRGMSVAAAPPQAVDIELKEPARTDEVSVPAAAPAPPSAPVVARRSGGSGGVASLPTPVAGRLTATASRAFEGPDRDQPASSRVNVAAGTASSPGSAK